MVPKCKTRDTRVCGARFGGATNEMRTCVRSVSEVQEMWCAGAGRGTGDGLQKVSWSCASNLRRVFGQFSRG